MGQNKDGTFTEIRKIVARDVDVNNKLKMSALFAIVQETANEQCVEFGCGWSQLMENYNACYILSRMRFEMKKHPGAGDTVVFRTWPNKNAKAIFTRYFTVESLDGEVYGSAVSQWALFDVKKRGVIRPSECNIQFPEIIDREEPFALPKGNLYPTDAFDNKVLRSKTKAPEYTDFDYNGHVNNARYVEWVENILPEEIFVNNNNISVIDIKYKHEISFHEFSKLPESERMVTMQCTSNEAGDYYIRSVLPDGREGVQCLVK